MQLIRKLRFAAAEKSFRYYKNIKDSDSLDKQTLAMLEFENIKLKLTNGDDNVPDKVSLKDFCKWKHIFQGNF